MILVIDNYDSFTYNVVQELGELGADLTVYRNDKITVDEIRQTGARTYRDLTGARLPGGRRRVAGPNSTSWARRFRCSAFAWAIKPSAKPTAAWSYTRRN